MIHPTLLISQPRIRETPGFIPLPLNTSKQPSQSSYNKPELNVKNSHPDLLKDKANKGTGKRTLFQRFFLGIKKGLLTPTLPKHILAFHNNIFIIIFRFICGSSLILTFTHSLYLINNIPLYTLIFMFNLLFTIYQFFLFYHRIKHMYKLFYSGALNVYNSPFDRFASYTARILWCTKGFFEGVIPFFFGTIIFFILYYTYFFTILFTNHMMIMCADLPGSEEPLYTEHANIYTPYFKEEMKEDVKIAGDFAVKTSELVVAIASAKTVADITSGDIPNATSSGIVAVGGLAARGAIKLGINEVSRKIDSIPEDHPTDEPVSPSAYDNDPYHSSIEIPFLKDLLEYIEGLDDENKLICYILILIFIVIYLQLFKLYKNYINKKINQLPFNNKYWSFFRKYKNFLNKYNNLYLNFIIGFFLFIAFLGLLFLIFLF